MDTYKPRVAELLVRFPDITAQRVFEILRDEGFTGGYSGVKRHVRAARPPPSQRRAGSRPPTVRARWAESDWSPYEVTFTTGATAIVQALSYVLVDSTRKYFGLYDSNDLHALMDGHDRAFARFGGCAHQCKYDSQKPVVLRWECNQPIYNPRFLAFASHYEFRPLAVRRGHPNDKPRTERSFWEVERSFLNGREFRDLDDMRAQLAHWLDTIVDHRKRGQLTALERFDEETAASVPYYAVPYDHVTDLLPVRITQRELFVYAADLRCVARHELAPRGAGLKLDPAGLHPAPQQHSPVDLDQLQVAFASMGDGAAEFFRLMSVGPPRGWSAQARQILLLRARYCTDGSTARSPMRFVWRARPRRCRAHPRRPRLAAHSRRVRRRRHRSTDRRDARSCPYGAA
ncbi:MAG: transposase [Myxococcales bacterium]|nr:transposase [Myxococcales bacterium]